LSGSEPPRLPPAGETRNEDERQRAKPRFAVAVLRVVAVVRAESRADIIDRLENADLGGSPIKNTMNT
jgi:hypothetical protein